MYPQIDIFPFTIYTFGLALSISFILFFFMLYKLSLKFRINENFFIGNILWFFLATFLFSRFFYIVAEWQDAGLIFRQGIIKFLLMSDYNFSLMGGVFWFMGVLLFQLRRFSLSSRKYIDAVVLAFFFAAIVGFIGAFFWGQIYGKPTDSFIGITYTSPISNSPYTSPMFPLALFYSFISFLLFVVLYMVRIFTKIEGFVGYVGVVIFSAVLIIAEFYNGNTDAFRTFFWLNLNQIGAIFLIIMGSRWLYKIYKEGQDN